MSDTRYFLLLDARAAHDVDSATVLSVGTAKEICDLANKGEYGEDCLVADENVEIIWEWFSTGKWIPDV